MTEKSLSIAVVGTTSSGKSSFINALCGRFILPVGVQETTRSMIEMIHTPNNLFISIENEGTLWKKITLPTDLKAREYLQNLPLKNSAAQSHLPITSRVYLSFAGDILPIFFSDGHNKEITLKILDLPGYNYQGDENNWEIIRNGIQDVSVLMMLFNAEETDDVKEDKFLKKLLEYQYERGKSWKEIFFILNRCDSFFRDDTGKSALSAKVESLQKRITSAVNEIFKDSSTPDIHLLSALPVMYGQVLFWNFEKLSASEKNSLLSQASLFANQCLSEDVCNVLPRSSIKWTYSDIKSYRDQVIKSCFYNIFMGSLKAYFSKSNALR